MSSDGMAGLWKTTYNPDHADHLVIRANQANPVTPANLAMNIRLVLLMLNAYNYNNQIDALIARRPIWRPNLPMT